MVKIITSPSNPLVKHISLLSEKSKLRKETGTFVVEGKKEIMLALKGGYQLKSLLFNPAIITFNKLNALLGNVILETECIEVNSQVYDKLAYREGTEGVIAVMYSRENRLDQLELSVSNPLVVVAEATEKPGNIGALFRTADAAGADAFIIANPNTDIYNPNIIRSSIGCVFTNQVATGKTPEIIDWLKQQKIKIICATIADDSVSCYIMDYTKPTAIVVGTEDKGLSQEWIDNADYNVIIPMRGQIDSMNVSVSAAILVFEAVRQRLQVSR